MQNLVDRVDSLRNISSVAIEFEEYQGTVDFNETSFQYLQECPKLHNSLLGHLQQAMPMAKISIETDDTLPMLFARMVIARNVFIPSDNVFEMFAGIGSFGNVFVFSDSPGLETTKIASLNHLSLLKGFENFRV